MMAKNSKAKWGNLLGYILLPFNIALQDDPLDYVRQAKASIDRKKHSFEAICTYLCARFLQKIFGVEVRIFFSISLKCTYPLLLDEQHETYFVLVLIEGYHQEIQPHCRNQKF